jgi:D-lactate dehydrogenase (cytochrome)
MEASNLILKLNDEHKEYLFDESRMQGKAESISFPTSESEVISIVKSCKENITIQGAQTGLSGGAVPMGGHVMNVSKMDRILRLRQSFTFDGYLLDVQPGVILDDLRERLKLRNFDVSSWDQESKNNLKDLGISKHFFAPDPTETTASIGGMVACNASGACSYKYGAMRNHVDGLRVVLCNGDVLDIKRGEFVFDNRKIELDLFDSIIEISLPTYNFQTKKNAAGFFVQDNMDLVDLFIGSEGILGVITQITLRIIPDEKEKWGLVTFFKNEQKALEFVKSVKTSKRDIAAIEFINKDGLRLIESYRGKIQSFDEIPVIKTTSECAIYIELHGDDEHEQINSLEEILKLINSCDNGVDNTWVATENKELLRIKKFRHALPESANARIDEVRMNEPNISAIFTDLAVLDRDMEQLLNLYNKDINKNGIEAVIYGHIGDSHLHINFLPKNMEEYKKSFEIYDKWAETIVRWGGTISAEHGVGKQKASMLKYMINQENLDKIVKIKKVFDPKMMFGKGNVYSSDSIDL